MKNEKPVPLFREIPLTQGLVALVDHADYEAVANYRWCALYSGRTVYAARGVRRGKKTTTVYLHRFILGISSSRIHVDHKDHNGLNCCRSNLRTATVSQNAANSRKRLSGSSGFKGVHRHRDGWQSTITVNRKRYYLGLFKDKREAFRAYTNAARNLFGQYYFSE